MMGAGRKKWLGPSLDFGKFLPLDLDHLPRCLAYAEKKPKKQESPNIDEIKMLLSLQCPTWQDAGVKAST